VKSSSLAFIGLIKKARAFVVGDALMAAIRARKVYAVLISTAASPRTHKQLVDKCTFYHIPVMMVDASTGLFALGEKTVVALGITRQNMALHLIDEEMRESHAKEAGSTSQQ
jgi:ribosomal protein L7Ae-like RNA K-turn-binding protein